MNIERPGSPSATTVDPASKRRSTSIETKRSRLASERPPKNGVASRNAFRSGELTAIGAIYSRSRRRQADRRAGSLNPPSRVERRVKENPPYPAKLAVKLQPVDDLVDHLAFGPHRQPHEV